MIVFIDLGASATRLITAGGVVAVELSRRTLSSPMKPTMLSFHIRKSSKIVLDKDCGTIYLSLTKCKSDMIQLDGLTDPFVVQYYCFFILRLRYTTSYSLGSLVNLWT